MIRDGDEIAIFGLGALLPMAGELARRLEQQGYSAAVINPRFVKPLDRELLAAYAQTCDCDRYIRGSRTDGRLRQRGA